MLHGSLWMQAESPSMLLRSRSREPGMLQQSRFLLPGSHSGVFPRKTRNLRAGEVTLTLRSGHMSVLQGSPTYRLPLY